jgi:hypothetical protein
MKTLLLPYATNKKPYWFAMDIYNSSPYKCFIYIRLQDYNGNIKAIFSPELEPYQHKIITSENLESLCPERFSLIIECADSIYVTPFLWYTPESNISTFSSLPIHTLNNFKDSIKIGKNIPVTWGSKQYPTHPFWVYAGSDDCSYMLEKHKNALEIIFRSIYWDFPDREARRVEIGDCCPKNLNEACKSHPGNSHKGGKSLDLNYFTFAGSNSTHYIPEGFEKVNIWEGNSLTDLFDWERTWEICKRIKLVFPNSDIRVDERIARYISTKLHENVSSVLSTDEPEKWGHHLHIHIYLGNTINYNAVIFKEKPISE